MDDRRSGDWKTRYCDEALRHVRLEAIYLAVHLGGVLLAVFVLAIIFDRGSGAAGGSTSTGDPTTGFGWLQILHAWLGGILGGAVFSIKWLVHAVAKNIWNIDRRLWRLFTPHVSGALCFAFVALMASGLVVIIDKKTLSSPLVCFGIGFLIGYFSDNAIGKLTELAQTLFGATKRATSHADDVPGSTASGK
jgi:hypothetical protein